MFKAAAGRIFGNATPFNATSESAAHDTKPAAASEVDHSVSMTSPCNGFHLNGQPASPRSAPDGHNVEGTNLSEGAQNEVVEIVSVSDFDSETSSDSSSSYKDKEAMGLKFMGYRQGTAEPIWVRSTQASMHAFPNNIHTRLIQLLAIEDEEKVLRQYRAYINESVQAMITASVVNKVVREVTMRAEEAAEEQIKQWSAKVAEEAAKHLRKVISQELAEEVANEVALAVQQMFASGEIWQHFDANTGGLPCKSRVW